MNPKTQCVPAQPAAEIPPVSLLHATAFTAIPWLRHSFSTRLGGVTTIYGRPDDLNLGHTREDDPASVAENRRCLIEATAAGTARLPWSFAHARQIHSDTILTLHPGALPPTEPADGLLTDIPGLFLAMLTADCVPILLADPVRRAIGVFHAGWRGTVASIIEKGVARMHTDYHSNPGDLIAAIGPSIGPCCYVVGEEVHTRFHEAFPYAADLFSGQNLNLWESNRRQLLQAGLSPENISVLAQCTACTRPGGVSRFFSHRADNGVTGRMMALIGIVPDVRPDAFVS